MFSAATPSGSRCSSRLYYGLRGLRIETWGLISLSGVTAIVAGMVLNRPARKAPWLLLAAALRPASRPAS